MKPKQVHFVCRGNTYRSRLAEALFKSFELPGYKVSSSGINAHRRSIVIEWYTKRLLANNSLISYASSSKTQTTNLLLDQADVIVFMNKDVYDEAQRNFSFNAQKALVWHVHDVNQHLYETSAHGENSAELARLSEATFQKIEKLTAELKEYLTHTSWVDIRDANNKPLGFRLPMAWAADRGLWHRGCHAIITTANKHYLVEKRSDKIVFAPGRLEVTMGGGVDSGESPRQAVRREIFEELGLRVGPEQIKLIDVCKWASYHPRYDKRTKLFLYTYHVALDENNPEIHRQQSEVARVELISQTKLNILLKTRRLKHLGSLNYGYQYYRRILKLARPFVG